jgi:transcriptional regulator with XRE-family HTH domain
VISCYDGAVGRGSPDRRRKPWRKTRALVAPGLGERIRGLRERLGLTQAQLGDGVLTGRYISDVENAVVRPSAAALDLIARKLGTTAVALGMISSEPPVEPLAGLTQALGVVRAVTTSDQRERRLIDHVEWVIVSALQEMALPRGDAPSATTTALGDRNSEADAPRAS